MSREQPQHQAIASTRRKVIGTAAKVAVSLPLLLRPNTAEAYDERHDRWDRWWYDGRRSFEHGSMVSTETDERRDRRDRWRYNGRYFFGHPVSTETKGKTAQNCFLRGTKILTTEGATRIENISIGDCVETVNGDCLPVKWVGIQHFRKAVGSNWQKDILPVRISRFALDGQTPYRDLYISAGHALFIDGVLIPAGYLINGHNVIQAVPEGTESIEYFHIELETHEVIFAEGAPTETFLVKDDREIFDNFGEYERLYGVDDRPPMTPFAPIAAYNGGRSELKSLLRRAASPVIDIRDPIQVAFDKIVARSREFVEFTYQK
jgi:hypothetical protein